MAGTDAFGSLQGVRRRLGLALPAAAIHAAGTAAVALLAALLVFMAWYPFPYSELSGGRELFFLVVGVDIVCGPLLTLVLYTKTKPRAELVRDLGLVVLIQLAALGYGLHTAYQARPLFLVHEVDRFRVIAEADFLGADVRKDIEALREELQPTLFSGPRLVGTRKAKDMVEHAEVMFQSLKGGRDTSQRPDFYVPYSPAYALAAVERAKPLSRFLDRFPDATEAATEVLNTQGLALANALFLPVAHRRDWIVILDKQGNIVGFMPGDGFGIV